MDMISRLRVERANLVGRLEEIDKILLQYDQIEHAAQRLLGSDTKTDSHPMKTDRVGQTEPLIPNKATSRAPADSSKTPIDEFQQAVIDVLKEANAPMNRVEIYDALTARGIVIGGGNRDKELNALSARVYRMVQAGQLSGGRGQGYSVIAEAEDDEDIIVGHGPDQAPQDPNVENTHAVDDDNLLGDL